MRRILESNPASVFSAPLASPLTEAVQALAQQLAEAPLLARFAYIYDYRLRKPLFVSTGLERLLGAAPPDPLQTVEWLYDRLHPDDAPVVAQSSVLVNTYIRECPPAQDFSQFVMSIDYRLRHAAGHYIRVLRYNTILERDHSGAVITTAAIYTDISHHKHTAEVHLHINRPDFPAFVRRQACPSLLAALTLREQEIAALVLEGLTSAQIAGQLGLSAHTIITHRRNIRRKAGTHSYHDLLRHLDG
jgi:DNA-binding CsgD family transcriptional regulator